jgi:hypothetical protein
VPAFHPDTNGHSAVFKNRQQAATGHDGTLEELRERHDSAFRYRSPEHFVEIFRTYYARLAIGLATACSSSESLESETWSETLGRARMPTRVGTL